MTLRYKHYFFIFSRVVANNFEQKDYWNRNSKTFNEYVVYDERQVAVRYVVKLALADQILISSNISEEDNESNSSNDNNSEDEDMDDDNEPSDEDEEMEEDQESNVS